MLQQVSTGQKSIETYSPIVGAEQIDELRELAARLKGLHLLYVNATPFGGGVAELLSAFVPLLNNLGIKTDWRIIYGDQRFFTITKQFHNALQGTPINLNENLKERYLGNIISNAKELDKTHYDVIVVNDPQPAALTAFSNLRAKWIWRAHIDMSTPHPDVWNFLEPFVNKYNAAIFTMEQFVPAGLKTKTAIIAPAIDINNTKNMELPHFLPRAVIKNHGVDIGRPIILQVSRFDPWKDPFGVIKTYRKVKEKLKNVQLVLVGALAQDDPEGWQMYSVLNEEAIKDPDMYVFTNQTSTGSLEVNAFQRGSDVVLQKSLKEGFGLVVSESLWKSKPVVAGRAGGIKLQMSGSLGDFLVNSIDEAAKSVIHFLENPEIMKEFGERGRKRVIEHFLMPRLIKEELSLISDIVGA